MHKNSLMDIYNHAQVKSRQKSMKYIGYIVLVIVFVVIFALSLLNAQLIEFNYLVGILHLPLIILMVLTFTVGLMVGMLLMLISRRSRKKKKEAL